MLFKGKDIAEILEYKDTNQAIRDNVSSKNKAALKDTIELLDRAFKIEQNRPENHLCE